MQRLSLATALRIGLGLALAAVAVPFACKTPTSSPSAVVKETSFDSVTVSESWSKDVKTRLEVLRASREQVDGAAESLAFAAASAEESQALGEFLDQVETNLEATSNLLSSFDRAIKEGKVEGDLANARQIARTKKITVSVKVKTPAGLVDKPFEVDAGFGGVAERLQKLRTKIESEILLKAGELLQQAPAARLQALKALRANLGEVAIELGVVIAAVDTWFGEGSGPADTGSWADPDTQLRWRVSPNTVTGNDGANNFCTALGTGWAVARYGEIVAARPRLSDTSVNKAFTITATYYRHEPISSPVASSVMGFSAGQKYNEPDSSYPVFCVNGPRGPADVAPPPPTPPPFQPPPPPQQPNWPPPPQPTWPPPQQWPPQGGGGGSSCGYQPDTTDGRIACKGQSGCDWDYTYKECFSTKDTTCSSYSKDSTERRVACKGISGCDYDYTFKDCFSTKQTDCPAYSQDSAERRVACKSISGCDYDYTFKDCFYTKNQGCYYYSKDSTERRVACKSTSGCDWDYNSKQCINN